HRARSISVLCRKVTGEDSYFLDGIDSRNNNQVIQPQAFVVHPINQVAVVPGLGTIDADTRVGASVICSASRKVWSGCCSTGLDRQQLRKASAIQRQIQNLSVIEQGRNSRGLGLQKRRVFVDKQCLLDTADLKLKIDSDGVGRRQHNHFANQLLKAGLL